MCHILQHFLLCLKVPEFPVFTRSGELTVSINLIKKIRFSREELDACWEFHHFVFQRVLRVEKDPMVFKPEESKASYIVVPLHKGDQK